MRLLSKFVALAIGLIVMGQTTPVRAQDLTVAYFLEWPMPFQYGKALRIYEKELGVRINWRSFDTGTAMSAAMASGDVQISVSQGVPPFVVATSAGQDLEMVDIAVSYSENDNCVISSDLEIDKRSASELRGRRVAVPLGTAAHFGFLRQMSHFKVPLNSLEVVNMAPAEGAAALAQGAVDMACGWGGALRRMKEHGNVLLTGAEKEELGILVFDVTSVRADFASEEPELLAKFLKITADMNDMWDCRRNKRKMLPVIARDAGMDIDEAEATMATFSFPSLDEQLSRKWMEGGVQKFMKGVADVFVEAGSIDRALYSYRSRVNDEPLRAADRIGSRM